MFDRTLWPALFEAAYRISCSGEPLERRGQLLQVALRDLTTEQEAWNKTKKLLSRVWVNPPPEATPMVRWAVQHPEQFPDRRAMHLGALLATFPFVGSVAAVIGRALILDGAITSQDTRKRVISLWGARNMVDLGASKTAGMLRKFDILEGGGLKPMRRGATLELTGQSAAWLIHALLLTRQQGSIDADQLADAPELFWARLSSISRDYPFLDIHREGGRRLVYESRCETSIHPNMPM